MACRLPYDTTGDGYDLENETILYGRNPVLEALAASRPADSVLLARGERHGNIHKIIALCKERGIPVKDVDRQKLDALCGGGNHQGVALVVSEYAYTELEDILRAAQQSGQPPFLIIADEITDPHNLGALLRTADAVGAHGVIIPKRRSVGLTGTVAKTSAGAIEHVPVARCTNLVDTAQRLKKEGLWIYGADMDGQSCFETDFGGPVALVVGAEGKGISRLLKETCDFLVSIPMTGHIESLNASVAGSILMYEVLRNRMSK